MDAQSRGRADEIDPADQWVLNPQTGNYELRLNQSAEQSSAARTPSPRTPAPRSSTRRGTGTPGSEAPGRGVPGRAPGRDVPGREAPGREVPGQRSRRAGSGSGGTTPPTAGRRKRKQPKSRKKKALLWTGGVMAFVLVGGSVAAYAVYRHFDGNLNTVDVTGAGSGGFKKDQAVNILVIGTDKRSGAGNESYGDKDSVGHADTTILFHVSKDRTNATALSIPRDLITSIPDCETKTGDGTKVIGGTTRTRFNESLGQEGRDPGCTMRTVKALTGVTVDHFMMADFNAVKTMTTAVGGVEVCLAKDIKDKDSKLNLTAGKHVIEGEEALAFVRTRHSVGFGGDLSRIEIQQQFLSSLIRKMKSSDTLSSPTKMWDLAEAATKALTVDSGIGKISRLRDLGMELSKVDPKNITFATVPVVDNTDGATVLLQESKAKPLFSMIQNDTSLTEVKQKEQDAKNKQQGLLTGPRAAASAVRVSVFNGSETRGAALTTLTWLQNEEGVLKSSNEGNAPQKLAATTLTYAPNQADQARKLADLMGLPATALKPGTTDAEGTEAMTLTLGADFEEAGVPITGPAKAPEGVQKVEADKQVCAK
ncbi:LCP family protein [Streptomyces lunaelactis]|uniref:LCP family protein n=1 Tax=Streptomyces lunaelactis TaxID=1535768 RepID=UPI0015855296|nr:LCP family protein [Streptomyces lunaelactis]NUK05805.1 LCP family protein [Streptomyces lunaelactis]NUK12420.1 LCP family protein [Streptomyces lunaelactis]NUK20308.1 LCP family protein [Streptomyces lunaelactis]NUK26601.1 LCP family protein [Streptomyces lunaelactis]NUK38816.1 LCP family protein [Streptomyces lunaelactis]